MKINQGEKQIEILGIVYLDKSELKDLDEKIREVRGIERAVKTNER